MQAMPMGMRLRMESTSVMGMWFCYVLKLLCCGVGDWERVAL
jgi:hypothetical protein